MLLAALLVIYLHLESPVLKATQLLSQGAALATVEKECGIAYMTGGDPMGACVAQRTGIVG
jgi:hypothetical protein